MVTPQSALQQQRVQIGEKQMGSNRRKETRHTLDEELGLLSLIPFENGGDCSPPSLEIAQAFRCSNTSLRFLIVFGGMKWNSISFIYWKTDSVRTERIMHPDAKKKRNGKWKSDSRHDAWKPDPDAQAKCSISSILIVRTREFTVLMLTKFLQKHCLGSSRHVKLPSWRSCNFLNPQKSLELSKTFQNFQKFLGQAQVKLSSF